MDSIEKSSLINKANLNEEFYFTSLIEEAFHKGILSKSNIEKIQMESLELLAYTTERYTNGKSSSVRVEVAESIMKSNFYTIGIYLKSFSSPDGAIKVLIEENIKDIYNKGRKLIESKLNAAKYIHHLVIKNLVKTDNITYNTTIIDGINSFFKIYNADFEAQEIHITADYPLCNPVDNLVGIEFIKKYLESINYENMFCNYFQDAKINNLLYGYNENYQDLIFNLFSQVFTCSIGCILAKTPVTNLHLSIIEVEHIYTLLSTKTKNETELTIINAYHELLKKLGITNLSLQQYMEISLKTITTDIFNAVKNDKLEKLFVQAKSYESTPKFYYSFENKMDNGKYREILSEIMQCRFTADKITIIKEKVKSFADLEDLYFDADLSAEEISLLLGELDVTEIAVLAKRHPFKTGLETLDLSETEIMLRSCLNKHIHSLPQEKQFLIERTIRAVQFEKE